MTIILLLYYGIEYLKYKMAASILLNEEVKGIKIVMCGAFVYLVMVFCNFFTVLELWIGMYLINVVVVIFSVNKKARIKMFIIFVLHMFMVCMYVDIPFNSVFIHKSEISYCLQFLMKSFLIFMLLLIGYRCGWRGVWNKMEVVRMKSKKVNVIIICFVFIIAFTIVCFKYSQLHFIDPSAMVITKILSVLAMISFISLIFLIFYIKDLNERMEIMLQEERELKQMQQNYYNILLQKEEDTRRYRHDMQNHYLCMGEIAKVENAFKTLHYINDLQQEIRVIQEKNYSTGNEILDIIFNYYLVGVEDTQIIVLGKCSQEIGVDHVDMCIIFGNLIQNAVEEVNRVSKKEKNIIIKIQSGQSFVQISITNTKSTTEKENLFSSEKKDKVNHGYGMRNIKKTVAKNDGKIEVMQTEMEFTVCIILKCVKNDISRS